MANLVTDKTQVGVGVATGRQGFGPVVRKRFDTITTPIAANAVLWACKVPTGAIGRYVMVDVKTISTATGTISVGSDKSATTVVNDIIASVNLETLGKTVAQLNLPTVSTVVGEAGATAGTVTSAVTVAGDAEYIVIKANHALATSIFDVAVFFDLLDTDAE